MNSIAALMMVSLSGTSLASGGAVVPGVAPAPETFYDPGESLVEGTKNLVAPDNLMIFGVGAVVALGAMAFDDDVVDAFAGRNRLGSSTNFGNKFWGTGAPALLLGVGGIAYGALAKDGYAAHTGQAHLEAGLVTFLATQALKRTVRRERPDGSNDLSFPSGHTSSAFATAAVLWEREGPWIGGLGVALGAYTGLSRMAVHKHHLSDVLFGATLGWVVGRAYARGHGDAPAKADEVTWAMWPYYEQRHSFGLALRAAF